MRLDFTHTVNANCRMVMSTSENREPRLAMSTGAANVKPAKRVLKAESVETFILCLGLFGFVLEEKVVEKIDPVKLVNESVRHKSEN